MPTYSFVCKKCGEEYDDLCSYDPKGKYKGVKCTECGSASKTQQATTCGFQFTNPEGTDRWNSETSGHDYRFKTNVPKVIEQRKQAELASHMGANPYADTSAKDIDMDTGIHDAETRSGLS